MGTIKRFLQTADFQNGVISIMCSRDPSNDNVIVDDIYTKHPGEPVQRQEWTKQWDKTHDPQKPVVFQGPYDEFVQELRRLTQGEPKSLSKTFEQYDIDIRDKKIRTRLYFKVN